MRALTAALAATLLLPAALDPTGGDLAPAWIVAPPAPAPGDAIESVLRDVSIVSPADVWAVGAWTDATANPTIHSLAAHWDGGAWKTAPTPDPAPSEGRYGLNAVDAVASDDVWAVGDITSQEDVAPLFLHYDGTAWTEQPAPAGVDGTLTDLDLLTAGGGWAVGTTDDRPLILRRASDQWVPTPAPALATAASLSSVFTTSEKDAWAVGTQLRDDRPAALVLHWDGTLWSEVTVPGSDRTDVSLTSVAATSAGDVWAVGTLCTAPAPFVCGGRVLHLASGTWRVVPTAPGTILTEVVPFSPTDVWIFGQGSSPKTGLDHIEHWDGVLFTIDATGPPVVVNNHPASALSLAAAAGDSRSKTLWAVGWVQGVNKATHAIYRG